MRQVLVSLLAALFVVSGAAAMPFYDVGDSPALAAPARSLTVTKAGTGTGTVTGPGINCGTDCSEVYPNKTTVTLTATPSSGSTFAGWSGAVTSTSPTVSLTINTNRSITATFNTTAPPPPPPPPPPPAKELRYSVNTDRSSSALLQGASITAPVCVFFVPPDPALSPVVFNLDSGAYTHTESFEPYDLVDGDGVTCVKYTFTGGAHSLTASYNGGSVTSTFSATAPPPPAQCADGLDNDGDTKIDYPADPGCASAADTDETDVVQPPDSSKPPTGGYFPNLVPASQAGPNGTLPSGATCAGLVHRSTWEPRPDNNKRNHTLVDANAVHQSLESRPRHYDPEYDGWVVPRIDGQFQGTTDETFQWAACKWGVPDNVIRAAAYQESTWYQYLVYPNYAPHPNRPVNLYGSGDYVPNPSADTDIYCAHIATFGYDYRIDYGRNCPETFSILGIKDIWYPAWAAPYPPYEGNQNGAFPFNRNSTAFAADYYAAELRTCLNSYIDWLANPPDDLWGCVGYWFSGAWHDSEADRYSSEVQAHLNNRVWLQTGFENDKPGCSGTFGCPGQDTLPF